MLNEAPAASGTTGPAASGIAVGDRLPLVVLILASGTFLMLTLAVLT